VLRSVRQKSVVSGIILNMMEDFKKPESPSRRIGAGFEFLTKKMYFQSHKMDLRNYSPKLTKNYVSWVIRGKFREQSRFFLQMSYFTAHLFPHNTLQQSRHLCLFVKSFKIRKFSMRFATIVAKGWI
jgi:hypothetical protein